MTQLYSLLSAGADTTNRSRPTYLAPFLPRLLLLTFLMLSSLALISFSVSTIPFLRLPTSLHVVKSQIDHLKLYSAGSASQFIHLAAILSLIFIWKQAFSIPGTILLNILIGAIYGTWISTLITCFLTAIGSTCAYQMARSIRPIILRLFPRPLKIIQRAVERFKIPGSSDRYDTLELSSYLLIARFLPVVPYSGLNLASGVLELPLLPFFWTLVIGSLPYNFLTTQVGDILSSASDSGIVSGIDHPNMSQIWSNTLLIKLGFISLLGVLPVLFKNQLRDWIQAFVHTRRTLPQHLSLPSKNTLFQRQQSCQEWVSDMGSKEKSCSISSQAHEFFSSPDPASSIVHLDLPDDQSDLSRTTSSSSLATSQERSPPPTLVIHFDGSPYDPSGAISDPCAAAPPVSSIATPTQTALKDNFNLINHPHHLPLFLSKAKSHSTPHPKLSIQSLFDLPYRKVAKIVAHSPK